MWLHLIVAYYSPLQSLECLLHGSDQQLSEDEIVGVLGHELGHWQMWHTTSGFLIGQVHTLAMFGCFSFFVNNQALYSGFGYSGQPTTIGVCLFGELELMIVGM